MKKSFLLIFLLLNLSVSAQQSASIRLYPAAAKDTINKNIYGHFAEHLGRCIYGGLWVGKNSSIPNTDGYRTDVFNALKHLNIPLLRWPGGCFADEYHWRDGIGADRPKMVNNNWGGIVEDNSFGTHEFLNLCEMLGCEPYVCGNVGSGTVEELAQWVEYMTAEGESPMANLRKQNGREKPWKVKYLGIGNETWGCGGDMTAEYSADVYKRYALYCRNFGDNRLFKIAAGPSDYDYQWTETLMKKAASKMHGLSLHYYTIGGVWAKKGSAVNFTGEEYYTTVAKALNMDELLKRHIDIMDKYDPDCKVGLMVDEWGTWWDEEPGTDPSYKLYRQNTMRDAAVAALTLNIFHKYPKRIQMSNIAQVVNVLQSLINTRDEQMFLTPTYHVFDLYRVHQNAVAVPLDIISGAREMNGRSVQLIHATASKNSEGIHISLTNTSLDEPFEITVDLQDAKAKNVTGQILTSKAINDHNTFEKPETVKIQPFNGVTLNNGTLKVKIPAKAIVQLRITN